MLTPVVAVLLGGISLSSPVSNASVPSTRIAYSTITGNAGGYLERYRVRIIDARGHHGRTVACTSDPAQSCLDRYVAFSPSGERLAILTASQGDSEREHLTVLSPAGRRLRGFRVGGQTTGFSWSPDGSRFAISYNGLLGLMTSYGERRYYGKPLAGPEVSWSSRGDLVSARDDTGDLVIRKKRGHRTRRINAVAYKPKWSPDGRRIAYLAKRGAYVINEDGSQRRLVSTHCDFMSSSVAWSPDGRELACGSRAGRLLITSIATGRARSLEVRFPAEIDWQRRP